MRETAFGKLLGDLEYQLERIVYREYTRDPWITYVKLVNDDEFLGLAPARQRRFRQFVEAALDAADKYAVWRYDPFSEISPGKILEEAVRGLYCPKDHEGAPGCSKWIPYGYLPDSQEDE